MTNYRSNFEKKIARILGSVVTYEQTKIPYTIPESFHTYTPDFCIGPNTFIETKGRFDKKDRDKHLLIKKQHPEIKIYFCFMNENVKIRKGSPTSYKDWCDKNGFETIHPSQLSKFIKPQQNKN